MRKVLGIFGLCWKLHIGVTFVVTAIFFYPIIFPFLFSEKGKVRAFKLFVAWSWVFRILCLYFVKKVKNEKLPDGPYLIVANHISYLDIFFMYSIFPRQHFLFLGKSEILSYPLIKTYFKRLNIPVYRGNRIKAAKSLVHAAREVKKGWSMVIFPEGKIPDENPKMARFKAGAFQLAKTVNLPIVPVTFTNNHLLFSDPTFILGPARPGVSKVHVHQFIPAEKVAELDQEELIKECFDLVNQPIIDRYGEL